VRYGRAIVRSRMNEAQKKLRQEGKNMAPPRKPMLELESPGTVGFKTTSMRLQGQQWAQVDIFSRAMGISVNEFIQRSVDAYLKHVAKKPEVQVAIRKQINQQKQMLDRLMKMTGVSAADLSDNGMNDATEDEDEAGEEDFAFEEVEDED
jgi:hypothetical protein